MEQGGGGEDLESQSPSWNKNGYYPNVNGSQSEICKEGFLRFMKEWAIHIKLGKSYPYDRESCGKMVI